MLVLESVSMTLRVTSHSIYPKVERSRGGGETEYWGNALLILLSTLFILSIE
jgi:hypothetical protein